MSYIPDPTIVTEPADTEKANTAAAEFRALKVYLRDVLLAGLTGKVAKGGDTMTGRITFGVPEALRINDSGGYLAFFNTAGTTRTGYLQFNAGGYVVLNGEASSAVLLKAAARTLTFAATGTLYADAGSQFGDPSARWGAMYAQAANFTGNVAAASFSGDGSGLTNLPPGGAPTYAQVVGALGYTPYNSSNPNGYISAVTSGMITAALTYTPYNSTNPSGYISGISGTMVNAALGYTAANAASVGSNAGGTRTVSTAAPSGGVDGDIWYQV